MRSFKAVNCLRVSRFYLDSVIRSSAILLALTVIWARPSQADVTIDGDTTTLRSGQVTVSLRRGELVRLTNHLTQETYVRAQGVKQPMLDMPMLKPPKNPYFFFPWRKGKGVGTNPNAVQCDFNDQTRTIWMNAMIDETTKDIVIQIWGEANREGVTGLSWGLRGLDLSTGKLILPAQGGCQADVNSPNFSFDYPKEWEAQMAIWQTQLGGFIIYSRDDEARYKQISFNRTGNFADIGLTTKAVAPFPKKGGVPALEWRINVYKGNWKVPANGYRNLMHFYRKPAPITAARKWISDIRSVVAVQGNKYLPSSVAKLATKVEPRKTLLKLTDWRREPAGTHYPDYNWIDGLREYVDKAHELGFRIMLPVNVVALSSDMPEFAKYKNFQVKDEMGRDRMGRRTNSDGADPQSFAAVNPASESWRAHFIRKLKEMIVTVQPDALMLEGAEQMWNDGNDTMDRRNFAEGVMALQRAILTAFPDVALGTTSINELVSPWSWFAERSDQIGSPGLASHPISTLLFGDHVLPSAASIPPTTSRFASLWTALEGAGVMPSASVAADDKFERLTPIAETNLKMVKFWQDHDLYPDWQTEWEKARCKWKGPDGTSAVAEAVPAGSKLTSGKEVFYRIARGSGEINTSLSAPGWNAFDENGLIGLNPKVPYLLQTGEPDKDQIHLSKVGSGTCIDYSVICDDFALFRLDLINKAVPISSDFTVDFGKRSVSSATDSAGANIEFTSNLINLKSQSLPASVVTFGSAIPVHTGDVLSASSYYSGTLSGGIAKVSKANSKPGVIFVESDIQVADVKFWSRTLEGDSPPKLALKCGNQNDSLSDGVRFSVRINGSEVWTKDAVPGPEVTASIDLSRWKGKQVVIELRAECPSGIRHSNGYWKDIRFTN